jgi:hypothetical protein
MECDKNKYKVYTWKHWAMLHWMINPGIIISELILGQRAPKITLVDKISDKPKFERIKIPCPHCQTIHDARIWSNQNNTNLKNWFGLYCPECGGIIPCLMNIFSFLILALTYPLWGWFRKSLKEKWLAKQPQRFEKLEISKVSNPFEEKGWIKVGLIWGGLMFVIMTFIFPFFTDDGIDRKQILINIPVWIIAGLVFGYMMKFYFNKRVAK